MCLFVGVCAGALQEACDLRLLLACPLRRVLAAYTGNMRCSYFHLLRYVDVLHVKAHLHGSPRLINTVESMKFNSTFERYCLHGSTKVNEAVAFKMAANELVREGVVVICDYLIKECQHSLEKRNKRKKTTLVG